MFWLRSKKNNYRYAHLSGGLINGPGDWSNTLEFLLQSQFQSGSFRPNFGVSRINLFWWVISTASRFGPVCVCVRRGGGGGGGGTLNFSVNVGLDPASTAYLLKIITHIRHSQIDILNFVTARKDSHSVPCLKKKP